MRIQSVFCQAKRLTGRSSQGRAAKKIIDWTPSEGRECATLNPLRLDGLRFAMVQTATFYIRSEEPAWPRRKQSC